MGRRPQQSGILRGLLLHLQRRPDRGDRPGGVDAEAADSPPCGPVTGRRCRQADEGRRQRWPSALHAGAVFEDIIIAPLFASSAPPLIAQPGISPRIVTGRKGLMSEPDR
ncbi:MAG: hypothetical protein E5V77_16845 [Mesorhizobium sp.]|nr:MAG: hypothetical protein E5V77_16845 [Mesorhizobium sp.]